MAPTRSNHFPTTPFGRPSMSRGPRQMEPGRSTSIGRETMMGYLPKNYADQQRATSLGRPSIFAYRPADPKSANPFGGGGKKTEAKLYIDKASQNVFVTNIFEYLVTHEYDNAFSRKVLQTPSLSQFNQIFGFLMHRLDETIGKDWKFDSEQILTLVKCLGYSYALSQKVFVAMGAPNTWPTLLCLLSWMIDLVKHVDDNAALEPQGEGTGTEMNLFEEYALTTFLASRRGKPGGEGLSHFHGMGELIGRLTKRNEEAQASTKDFEGKFDGLRLALRNLNIAQPELIDMDNRVVEARQRIDHVTEVLVEKERELRSTAKTLAERRALLARGEATLNEVSAEEARLGGTVDSQEMTREDEDKFLKEVQRAENLRAKIRQQRSERSRANYELGQAIEELVGELEALLLGYNELGASCREFQGHSDALPFGRANHEAFESADLEDFMRGNTTVLERLVTVDVRGPAKRFLKSLKEELNGTIRDEENQLLDLNVEVNTAEERAKDLRERNADEAFRLKALLEAIELEGEVTSKATAEFTEKKEQLQRELLVLRGIRSELEASKAREGQLLRKTIDEHERRSKDIAAARRELQELLAFDVNLLATQKREVSEGLRSLEGKVTIISEKVRSEFLTNV